MYNIRRARGVTLIEILLVIAIILTLMGLLLAAIGPIRMRSKMAATRLLLDGISASLHRYHMDFDEFPDSFGAPGYDVALSSDYESTEDDGRLYAQLNGADGAGPVRSVGTPYEKRFSPYLPLQPENMRKDPATNTVYIVDNFDPPNRIRYFNSEAFIRCYVTKNGGTAAAKAKAESMVHRKDFELYSLGPIGKKQTQAEAEDERHNLVDDGGDPRIDDKQEYDVDAHGEEGNDITNWD